MLKTEGASERRPSVDVAPLEIPNEDPQETDRGNKKKNKQGMECPQGNKMTNLGMKKLHLDLCVQFQHTNPSPLQFKWLLELNRIYSIDYLGPKKSRIPAGPQAAGPWGKKFGLFPALYCILMFFTISVAYTSAHILWGQIPYLREPESYLFCWNV